MSSANNASWRGDLAGATAGTLASLPAVVTMGLLAYAVLGSAGAAIGVPAAFVSVVVGGLVFAWLGRGPMPAGAPTAALVLILADLVARVARDPAFNAAQPGALAALLALTAAAVIGMGLLQWLVALLGLVRIAKFVPQPVLAGFMNGVSLVIVVSQLPPLLGWPAGTGWASGWSALASTQPAALAIGLFTLAVAWFAPRLTKRLPATFIALLLGSAVYFAVARLAPGVALGPLTGPLPQGLPRIDLLLPWFGGDATGLLLRHAASAATTALLLALIGTLTLVLDGLALDQVLHTRTDARRELFAQGAANMASGAFGGLPVLLHRGRAMNTALAGGRAPQALFMGTAMFALLALFGAPLLALLPKVVMAGIMLMIAWTIADQWTHRMLAQWLHGQRTPELQFDLAVVAIVAAVTLVFGLLPGVGVGAVLAVMLFIRSMNRSLLRARYSAAQQPSRRMRTAEVEAMLQGLRGDIEVLELEGALFFGSADRLVVALDALPASCRAVVLDFRRISLIDSSGAVVLSQVAHRLRARGTTVRLASVAVGNRHGRALSEFAGPALSADDWYADVDQAVEAAEEQLLLATEAWGDSSQVAVALEKSSLMTGLDAAQCVALGSLLEPRRLAAGERLFSQGDPGDRLYVLSEGSISIFSHAHEPSAQPATDRPTALRQRYVSFSPGMMLGEIAMLDGGGRSADGVADRPSLVHALSCDALAQLQDQDPKLCALVYRNIAHHLSERLRAAAVAWRGSMS